MEGIVPIGTYLVQIMETKYSFSFPKESIEKNISRLTNQLWKLIPMYENEEDWQKQLNTVIIEVAGLHEIFIQAPQFLQLLSKLEGMKTINEFSLYRKTVFEEINLLQELKNMKKIKWKPYTYLT